MRHCWVTEGVGGACARPGCARPGLGYGVWGARPGCARPGLGYGVWGARPGCARLGAGRAVGYEADALSNVSCLRNEVVCCSCRELR